MLGLLNALKKEAMMQILIDFEDNDDFKWKYLNRQVDYKLQEALHRACEKKEVRRLKNWEFEILEVKFKSILRQRLRPVNNDLN
jgi:hypothetical protein